MKILQSHSRRRLSRLSINQTMFLRKRVENLIRLSRNQTARLSNLREQLKIQTMLRTQTMQHCKISSPEKMIFTNQIPNTIPCQMLWESRMSSLCNLSLVEEKLARWQISYDLCPRFPHFLQREKSSEEISADRLKKLCFGGLPLVGG
jgi:hypothetical protein